MDRHELYAAGFILYGDKWEANLTRSLGLSPVSRTIGKIVSGAKPHVSAGIEQDLIALMKYQSEVLHAAIIALEGDQPQQILLRQSEGRMVVFDIDGVTTHHAGDAPSTPSPVCVVCLNFDIDLRPVEYRFQSLIISHCAKEALRLNDQRILQDAIHKYFDVSWVGRENWLVAAGQ